jgi:hypothetical protein
MTDNPPQSGDDNGAPKAPRPGLLARIARAVNQLPDVFAFDWLWGIPFTAILGVAIIPIYAQFIPAPHSAWNMAGSALAFAAAAFLAGGLLGFLFGIPKAATSAAQADSKYTANTNLEQISDWLTKIVVGLTLTQLGRIPGALGRLADNMKAPLGGQASSAALGLALVIFYALLGFIYLYLWSRTLLMRELTQSDKDAQNGGRSQ